MTWAGGRPEDELEAVEQELETERRYLALSERSEVEGRVADRDVWLQALDRRRARIRELERQRDELVALEESAAELAEAFRPGDAA